MICGSGWLMPIDMLTLDALENEINESLEWILGSVVLSESHAW